MFAVLSEVSQALVLHKPLAELLDHVMDLISGHLSMDRGVLMLREGNPDPAHSQGRPGHQQAPPGTRRSRSAGASSPWPSTQQLAVLTSDAALDPRFKGRESIIDSGIHSAMCVPLWNNKEVIGIIYADRISLLQPFSEEDLRLLTLLSNLAAVKIENAMLIEQAIEKEKMERELQLAVQIQKDFPAQVRPATGRSTSSGRNVPCRQVGGDYYDFIPIDPGRLGVTVADVSGKGVSASLLMASLRAALHSEVRPQLRIDGHGRQAERFRPRRARPSTPSSPSSTASSTRRPATFVYVNAGHNAPVHPQPGRGSGPLPGDDRASAWGCCPT